jgi:hypothetical protein
MTLDTGTNMNTVATNAPTTTRTFNKPVGKINIKKIDNVLTKAKDKFNKLKVQDWGDLLMQDKDIKNIIETDKANDVANKDPRFDPAVMGIVGYVPLGVFIYDEEYQRLMEKTNSKRILRNFDLRFFTCVYCIKFSDPTLNVIDNQSGMIYANTIDGWHHLIDLYIELRAGNIKGWEPEDWADFPVPTQTWVTDDPTLPGRLSLMINGEGQSKWGEFEYLRIHSNNWRLYSQQHPTKVTTEDKLAYDQVMACIKDGNSVPMNKEHKDAKKDGVISHIGAITDTRNKDITRLKFIMSQNENWWPLEKRSAAMFGFYGHIYDEFIRTGTPLKGQAFDDQMTAYNYIVQHVFGNLENAMKAVAGKNGALKKLEALSNQGWKTPGGDNSLLAMIEILYMDYFQGPARISAARGSHVWYDKSKKPVNIVDALMKLPSVGAGYTQKISTL